MLLLRSFVQLFIFQSLSMSLFLNILFETDSYSNEYLLAKLGVDAAANEPLKVCQKLAQSFFFARIRRSDLTKKLEKVGPFECDELEKHCRVSAKCYPTRVPALYTMTKEKFKSGFLLLLLVSFL